MTELSDMSPMPFGKYGPKPDGAGLLMQDVPASYLHWLWVKGGLKDQTRSSAVAAYIYKNLPALKKEYPDGIWT